jgi:hypothetical protein
MPDWLPSLVIAVAACSVMVWLVERVAPGAWREWLLGGSARTRALRATMSPPRTIAIWTALVVAALVLAALVYAVFSAKAT